MHCTQPHPAMQGNWAHDGHLRFWGVLQSDSWSLTLNTRLSLLINDWHDDPEQIATASRPVHFCVCWAIFVFGTRDKHASWPS